MLEKGKSLQLLIEMEINQHENEEKGKEVEEC